MIECYAIFTDEEYAASFLVLLTPHIGGGYRRGNVVAVKVRSAETATKVRVMANLWPETQFKAKRVR